MSALSQSENLIPEIDDLNSQAWSLNSENPLKAIELAKLALSKAENISYGLGIAMAKKTLGACSIWTSENEEGVQYCLEAAELFRSLKDKQNEASVYYYSGANLFYLKEYEEALVHYKISYDLNLKINNELGMADALIGKGTVYYTIDQNDKALKLLLESEKLCKKIKNKTSLVKAHEGLGETFYNLKKYDKAILYFGSCVAFCKELGTHNTEASAFDGLGRTYSALERYDDAIDNYESSLKLKRDLGLKFGEAATLNNIGKLYIRKNDTKKAIELYVLAFQLAEKIKSRKNVYRSTEKLAELYELEGNTTEAFKYYKIFHHAVEEERNLKNKKLTKNFEQQHKVFQSQTEKAIIEERGREQDNFSDQLTLMSKIGQQIISSFDVETIVNTVYESVNGLMDATGFGIGIYHKPDNVIMFPLFIEGEERFENLFYELSDMNRLAAVCFNNSQEIILNDVRAEIGKYIKQNQAPKAGKEVESLIYLPLIYKENVLGVITVQSFNTNSYSNYHLNILKNLATYIAIALENAKLYHEQELKVVELEKTFENTRLVSEIGKEISSTFSIREIISKVYNSVNQLMDATMFGIGIFDPKTERINFSGVMESGKILDDYFYTLQNIDRPAIWCFTNQKEYVINCFTDEFIKKNKISDVNILKESRTESVIYVPVTQNDKKIGVITVQSYQANVYTDYHLQLLKSIAVYTAIAIDNASLYSNMEQRVAERTTEVTKQKELLEKNFNDVKLSAQIAKDIASSFTVETIVAEVYDNVKSVINAESFGIGVYDQENQTLRFDGFIEKDEKLPVFEFSLKDKNSHEVLCFKNQQEIIINDNKIDFNKYIKHLNEPINANAPDSQVFLPLFTKEKKIGVLTAQSFKENAFQEYELNILKNIALSVATALDNLSFYHDLELKVEERTGEVHKQKMLVEEKNKDITDSIKYAKIIQQTIAPNIDEFNRNFTDSFILYKPKDIVSGDFYWFEHFGETTVFAAADCTGHGVPGAFMSLICNEIMDKVITEQKVHDPAKALTLIDERLVRLIKKSAEATANDGMEIALCTYEKRYKIISFAGAHRPLFLIRDKQIIEYKPNIFSIGGNTNTTKNFEMTEIKVKSGDVVYLLTDGYLDQFGGEKGKKFMVKNFKELVLTISDKPMKEQKEILDETFEEWRGITRQVDDVCVMGVRI